MSNTKTKLLLKTNIIDFRTFKPNYEVHSLSSPDRSISDRQNRIHLGLAAVDQSIGRVGTIKSTKLDDNGMYTFVPVNTKTGKQIIHPKHTYLNSSELLVLNGTSVLLICFKCGFRSNVFCR